MACLGRVYVLHRKRVSVCSSLVFEYIITSFGQYPCERRTSRLVDTVKFVTNSVTMCDVKVDLDL